MESALAADGSVRFKVKYDGPAIRDGRMDARTLAPAMLATAHLFEHTAQLLGGSAQGVKIEVDADFKGGSFSYEVVAGLATVGMTLLSNLSISDVVATGAVLIQTVKAARGRKPASVAANPANPAESKIVFHDGDSITVNVNVAKMFVNPTVRADLEGTVEPLKVSGIDEFELTSPVGDANVLGSEVGYFAAPVAEEEVLQDSPVEEIIEVVVPDFRSGNKWQVRLAGEGVVWTGIEDKAFMSQVESHQVTFGKGDLFRVQMQVRVVRTALGKLDRQRTISRVIERVPRSQGELF